MITPNDVIFLFSINPVATSYVRSGTQISADIADEYEFLYGEECKRMTRPCRCIVVELLFCTDRVSG